MGALIRWLHESGDDHAGLVGGKGANLGRLLRMELPVPPGFVVTTEAYRTFIAASHLEGVGPEELRERILAAPIPTDVSVPIFEAYQLLDAPAVAVRSSGTAEDLATASFAGQHDTFLNVVGAEALLAAVRACWASLWSPRAIEYRQQRRWDDRDIALAVVVQTMVPAELAGVLFTADPVSGRRDRIVVEAVRGLGEDLVSGKASGSRYVVEKASLRLLDDGATVPRGVIEELARRGTQVETAFGCPQDIEWAYADGRCYLLQARPLTALPEDVRQPLAGQPRRYSRAQRAGAPNVAEHIPVPPYPFDYSLFFRPLMERMFAALRSLGVAPSDLDDVFLEVADGVVQVVPPTVRPTPKVLLLPTKLPAALRARPDDWLAKCRDTLVATAQQIDREDLVALSDEALLLRIEDLQRLQMQLIAPRFGRFPRGLLASQGLKFLLRLATGAHATALERDLLAAVPCVTTEANHALVRLAQRIRTSDELRHVFQEEHPERLPDRLGDSVDGRAILGEVDGFLQRYGYRETAMPSAALPSWRDDPSIVFGLLKGLVAGALAASSADMDDGEPAERAKREAIAALSRRWPGLGKRVLVPLFVRLLDATRAFVAFREDSHFYLFMPFPVIRRLALELGRRLVERRMLEEAADIFFLKVEEIERLGSAAEVRETVRKRKEARRSMEGRYTTVPAELLAQSSGTDEVRGVPVSPGQVVGRVRVILNERDFWKLQKGEVLVARYTNPTWTPLFAVASAVVVDVGGASSHAAIVAREYGIPAVMGTGDATTKLRDGQQVLVDGAGGRVVPVG